MIKTNSTIVSSIFAFGVLYMALFGQAAVAADPGNSNMPVRYQNTEEGSSWLVYRYFNGSHYEVGLTSPWCSHYTPCRFPREYDHYHFADGFPFDDLSRGNEVTKQKATWHDEDYWVGWTKVEDPTCEYNCHGYAMAGSSGPNIESSSNGSDRWCEDSGYESISEAVDDCIGHTTSHSWVIDYVWSCEPTNLIRTVSEKSDGQGAYRLTFDEPGDAEEDTYRDWESNLYDD